MMARAVVHGVAGTDESSATFYLPCMRYGDGGSSMMDFTTMHTGMMLTAVIYHLAIFIFAILGIAASIKYLRS
jgi:hypothetical protein